MSTTSPHINDPTYGHFPKTTLTNRRTTYTGVASDIRPFFSIKMLAQIQEYFEDRGVSVLCVGDAVCVLV